MGISYLLCYKVDHQSQNCNIYGRQVALDQVKIVAACATHRNRKPQPSGRRHWGVQGKLGKVTALLKQVHGQEKTPAFREEAGAKVYSISREVKCMLSIIMLHRSNASAAIKHFAFTLRNG